MKVEEIKLYHTLLTEEQLEGIITAIADCQQIKLKKIDLRDNNLSSICAEILATSTVKLENISLENTELSPDQIIGILTRITDGVMDEDIKLKHLEIGGNDLSKVPAELLVQSLLGLEDVSLKNAKLSADQMRTMFTTISERKDMKLSSLDLRENDISSVSESLIKAVKVRVSWLYLENNISPEYHRIVYPRIGQRQ